MCRCPMPLASINRSRLPSRLLEMMLAGRAPVGAPDMVRVYSDQFPSPEAARAEKHRCGGEVEMLAE